MNLRNITIKGYEWVADVWADELSASDIRALCLAGTEYEEVSVQGEFYVTGPSTPNWQIVASRNVLVAARVQSKTLVLPLDAYKQIRMYLEKHGDNLAWQRDHEDAKGDSANEA